MRKYKTKAAIRDRLMESLKTGEGIYTEAISMESGQHHWWLTGTSESYQIHCYGRGLGWRDQSDGCDQDLEAIVDHIWRLRKYILEGWSEVA